MTPKSIAAVPTARNSCQATRLVRSRPRRRQPSRTTSTSSRGRVGETGNTPNTTLSVARSTMPSARKNTASAPRKSRIARSRPTGESVGGRRSGGGEHRHAPRLLALVAGRELEFDDLALLQAAVAVALDLGEVHEHVALAAALDEAEALAGVEPLD